MTQHDGTNQPLPNRRGFVAGTAAAALAGFSAFARPEMAFADEGVDTDTANVEPLIAENDIVLFQGDSITDAGRDRKAGGEPNSSQGFGKGYAWMAASQMLVDRPNGRLKMFNRGISGNKVFQLAERWQADCLDIKPNVLSILIGVNDFAHVFKHGYEGTLEKYESDYHALIERTKDALAEVKLIICEPFIVTVGLVDETWVEPFAEYRAAARRVAEKAGARFVEFQTMFDRAVKLAPPKDWVPDGVHPSPLGAALMAHWWMKTAGA